ncbi:amastin-like surface protein, putative [Leishmania guyanensis]
MTWNLALLIYAIVQFIAFLLVLVATPIDMFRLKSRSATVSSNQCITLWGLKKDCKGNGYDFPSEYLWEFCSPHRNHFRLAQAFALISIFVYGAAFVLGVIMLFCCRWLHLVSLALNIVGAVTLCVVWVAMVVTFNRDEDPSCLVIKSSYTYGAGIVLLLVAWVLDILNIAALLLPCPDIDSGESEKTTEIKDQDKESEQE